MTELLKDIWAVQVPEDAELIAVYKLMGEPQDLCFWSNKGSDWNEIPLSSGNWKYLFCSKAATEEEAASIVKKIRGGGYKDYGDGIQNDIPYVNPEHSLHSLLRSKGLDPNKNYAIIQKEK